MDAYVIVQAQTGCSRDGPSRKLYWVYKGIMEKNMETTLIYRGDVGNIGIMDKKMETTI